MQQSGYPAKIPAIWASQAASGYINTIPLAPSGTDPLLASYQDGFPAGTFGASGSPPYGQDVNGILNAITAAVQAAQAGAVPAYDATFSGYIGGYPKGALIASATAGNFWLSTTDNNTTNPDTGGAGWAGIAGLYLSNVVWLDASTAANNVTLTLPFSPATGAVVAFRVKNTNTGATAISINGGGGVGILQGGSALSGGELVANWPYVVVLDNGTWHVIGSGAGAVNGAAATAPTHFTTLSQFSGSFADTGWVQRPDGVIEQWGACQTSNGSGTITWPKAFPNAVFKYSLIVGTAGTGISPATEIFGDPFSATLTGANVYSASGTNISGTFRVLGR